MTPPDARAALEDFYALLYMTRCAIQSPTMRKQIDKTERSIRAALTQMIDGGWREISHADEVSGTVLLYGLFPNERHNEIVVGHWVEGYTYGWETNQGNVFYPTHIKPITPPQENGHE